ncbi:MAG TPA: hypothetical protein VGK97_12365, partial [Spongiibacteraceae bacterium]
LPEHSLYYGFGSILRLLASVSWCKITKALNPEVVMLSFFIIPSVEQSVLSIQISKIQIFFC